MPMVPKMLIVDDEETLQFFFNEMFYDQFIIKKAASADEARNVLKEFKPDIILLDIKMGPFSDRGGLELLRELREAGNKTDVIIVSAIDDPDDIEEAERLGIRRYLKKPFKPELLREEVYNYLKKIGRMKQEGG